MTKLSAILFASVALAACVPHQPGTGSPLAGTADPVVPKAGHEEMPSMTLESIAEGAILFDDLGDLHRPVTTQKPEAQAFFDQGLRLTFAFNHDEATRSYAKAAALDPTCAMCFWGVAFTLGPNYNVPMLPDRAQAAWEALQEAKGLVGTVTPVEQALIGALERRYQGPEPLDPPAMQPYNEAFAAAMREVARRFPEDLEVQVLFAEAMMDVNPWKLWSLDGTPAPGTEEILATLEAVLAKDPQHPGANHYYIHAIEASKTPEKGLPAAERLGGLMPGAGHLVHMPAHILQRVGRYADASQTNRKAAEVDLAYMAETKPPGYYPMYLGHNYGFLAYSASMEGRSGEAIEASRNAARQIPPEMLDMMPGMDFFVSEPLLAMVRFGKWEELLAEPRPPAKFPVLTGIWLHAHGMALASTGEVDEALADHAALLKLAGEIPAEVLAGLSPARDLLAVGAKALEARIAEKQGKPEAAIRLWTEAVALEDRLAYSEPADWFYPGRHYLGAVLLAAKKPEDAEAVYREDLKRNPGNGWALYGLVQALEAQQRAQDAAEVDAAFRQAWARADIQLTSSAF